MGTEGRRPPGRRTQEAQPHCTEGWGWGCVLRSDPLGPLVQLSLHFFQRRGTGPGRELRACGPLDEAKKS